MEIGERKTLVDKAFDVWIKFQHLRAEHLVIGVIEIDQDDVGSIGSWRVVLS